jgi:hypothetical protein
MTDIEGIAVLRDKVIADLEIKGFARAKDFGHLLYIVNKDPINIEKDITGESNSSF